MGYSVYYCGDVSVEPPLTEEDAVTFLEIVNDKRTDRTKPFFDLVAASNESQTPYSIGLLELSDDQSQILPETDESRAGAGTWLQLVVQHFLAPKGYSVEGEITWNGDEAEDRGCIYAKDQQVEVVDDRIENPGPSWEPAAYASPGLKEVVQKLIASADNTGCSPDLTVVAAAEIEALKAMSVGL
jgi:hypothetical protein